jgi:hypothetical protein
MKVIFSSLNLVELHHLKNLLQSAGIRCRIHREDLARLAGEVPFPECSAQLVIEPGADAERAQEIVREFAACPEPVEGRPARNAGSWACPGCGERLEGQFTACWKCGSGR